MRRVAVVTGGTAGVGRATAIEFARRGYAVAFLARDATRVKSTSEEIETFGIETFAKSVDVSARNAVEAAAEEIVARFCRVDVWINDAFAGVFSRFSDMSAEEFERVTTVTYLVQVNGTRAALKIHASA